MHSFGLNHMTSPRQSVAELLAMAHALGCVGVEFRNDLASGLFGGEKPEVVRDMADKFGLKVLGLAEVKGFNDPDRDVSDEALALIQIASAVCAQGVALIPNVANTKIPREEQRAALRQSLIRLQPVLEAHGQIGLIEPLGFTTSTLRFKEDVASVLDELSRPECFRIIHDTFHHHLAQTDTIQAELTALVHVSGIDDVDPNIEEMADAHRVLVGSNDRLKNITQLRALKDAGFEGPLSFEAFAPEIHTMTDPATALAESIGFITDQLVGVPA